MRADPVSEAATLSGTVVACAEADRSTILGVETLGEVDPGGARV